MNATCPACGHAWAIPLALPCPLEDAARTMLANADCPRCGAGGKVAWPPAGRPAEPAG